MSLSYIFLNPDGISGNQLKRKVAIKNMRDTISLRDWLKYRILNSKKNIIYNKFRKIAKGYTWNNKITTTHIIDKLIRKRHCDVQE